MSSQFIALIWPSLCFSLPNPCNSCDWARLNQEPGTQSGSATLVADIQILSSHLLPPSLLFAGSWNPEQNQYLNPDTPAQSACMLPGLFTARPNACPSGDGFSQIAQGRLALGTQLARPEGSAIEKTSMCKGLGLWNKKEALQLECTVLEYHDVGLE